MDKDISIKNLHPLCKRREFLGGIAAAGAIAALSQVKAAVGRAEIRAVLLHPGLNMWGDWKMPDEVAETDGRKYVPDHIRFDEAIWNETVAHMAARGMNMVVMDLGEFMEFPSHPELAVKGSWSPDRMKAELKRLRNMGLEPIPKLNFSASHDQWLKIYHRMISTPQYYRVVKDVIRDTVEIFGTPRLFHLGWDEERVGYERKKCHFSMRSGELWWKDFLYTVRCAEDCGCRAWVWSDYGWNRNEEYVRRCPKSVVQSNWYYDEELGKYSLDPKVNKHAHRLVQFQDLEKAGFDQIPCGTNWAGAGERWRQKAGGDDIIGALVPYCRRKIAPERLLGFMMAPWGNLEERGEEYDRQMRAIDLFAGALGQGYLT